MLTKVTHWEHWDLGKIVTTGASVCAVPTYHGGHVTYLYSHQPPLQGLFIDGLYSTLIIHIISFFNPWKYFNNIFQKYFLKTFCLSKIELDRINWGPSFHVRSWTPCMYIQYNICSMYILHVHMGCWGRVSWNYPFLASFITVSSPTTHKLQNHEDAKQYICLCSIFRCVAVSIFQLKSKKGCLSRISHQLLMFSLIALSLSR